MGPDELYKFIEEGIAEVIKEMTSRYEGMAGVLLSEKEREAMDWILNQAMNYGASLFERSQTLLDKMPPPKVTVVVIDDEPLDYDLNKLIKQMKIHKKEYPK